MVGPERCLVVKPNENPPNQWPGMFVTGSTWIRMKLDTGWKIVQDPRNHLTSDYKPSDYLTKGAAEAVSEDAQPGNHPLQTPQPPVKRGPGRPPKNR